MLSVHSPDKENFEEFFWVKIMPSIIIIRLRCSHLSTWLEATPYEFWLTCNPYQTRQEIYGGIPRKSPNSCAWEMTWHLNLHLLRDCYSTLHFTPFFVLQSTGFDLKFHKWPHIVVANNNMALTFAPKSDQFQIFPLQPHQKYYITQYDERGIS